MARRVVTSTSHASGCRTPAPPALCKRSSASWTRSSASSTSPTILELVRLRASYLNGCARCVDMHTKDARAAGETEQRLYAVPVWRDTPFFTPRERAALAWTEGVTELGREGVPDDVYEAARSHFSEEELVRLTVAVVAINGWNRLNVAFRSEVGSYRPRQREASR